jgi:uncharacterized protein (TIGR03435 family)
MGITPLISLSFVVGSLASAQPLDPLSRFEAVNISRSGQHDMGARAGSNEDCSGGPGTSDPRHLKCDVSFAQLVGLAYRLGPIQFGAQPWMESTRFKFEATVPAGATQDQVRIMERNLLAERFKLTAHFIKKTVAAYEMQVAKSGRKFKTAQLDAKLKGSTFHGFGVVGVNNPLSMEQLASFLSNYLDLPVVDLTGLAGIYDIRLQFTAPTGDTANPARMPSAPPVDAVRDQLGLILERTTSAVDFLVVDHAEKKPTKN